jgi:acetylornithine deacetylase
MSVVEVLRELIAIDSTSARSNLPMLDALERHARALGFITRRQPYGEKANLICSRGGEKGGLALVGHTDCVPFDAAWSGALRPEERDGKLYGRGSADTKAFLAASLTAASRTSGGPLQLVFTADEEIGCIGARRLQEEGALRPRYAIVGEPTRLIPVIGHKGYCMAEVTVRGVEGHSAFPETGSSAIFAAARMLREIEKVAADLQQERDDAFAPPYTTLNVGLISGGKAKNVIPGSCSFTLEWRPLPGQDPEHVARLVKKLQLGEVDVQRLDRGILQPRNSTLVEFIRGRTGNAAETIPFGTELPYLAALGAEACVFGPGDIRVAHRTGEFVPLEELEKAVDILAGAIEKFAA